MQHRRVTHNAALLTQQPGKLHLPELATHFAALVRVGVDIDVPVAGHQVVGLGVGQRRRALERACRRLDRDGDAAVLAGRSGFVAVSYVAVTLPVPALWFGGTSLDPLRSALNFTVSA
jgi:hypothetical protein